MSDETGAHYRNCFGTGSGRYVLHNMLEEAKFFGEVTTPEEVAVENFMKIVLHKLEIYDEPKDNSRVIDRMFDIPLRKEVSWLKKLLKRK